MNIEFIKKQAILNGIKKELASHISDIQDEVDHADKQSIFKMTNLLDEIKELLVELGKNL